MEEVKYHFPLCLMGFTEEKALFVIAGFCAMSLRILLAMMLLLFNSFVPFVYVGKLQNYKRKLQL